MFSIVIPAYNSASTIDRALSSLIPQKELVKEVIVCDDRSTDNTAEIAMNYSTFYPVSVLTTPEDLDRGPGNARQLGLEAASGDWVAFMDADDYFAQNILFAVKDAIDQLSDKDPTFIISNFAEADFEKGVVKDIHSKDHTWLHGKFYKTSFLRDNNIVFKKNLYTHEDVYFNARVLNTFKLLNKEYFYLDAVGYYWNPHEGSMTSNPRYTEMNLEDFICGAVEPALIVSQQNSEFNALAIANIVDCFLKSYFYQQVAQARYADPRQENLNFIKYLLDILSKDFNISVQDLFNYFNENANMYMEIKNQVANTFGSFIETISLRDFLSYLSFNVSGKTYEK